MGFFFRVLSINLNVRGIKLEELRVIVNEGA